ncbi:DUF6910 family protein [Actinoplanes sp. NPDC048796]|uniref:DUF6910 family protein n=1 Tax=Actinoplanes sp. NPDC048796 TaxID=3155640 RepID=UPI0033FE4C71
MRLSVRGETALIFDDGSPVRAASAVAPFGDGWLIAQDDATHAAWRRPGSIVPVRVLDQVEGLDVFSSAAGTKHLKPDFEAAFGVGEGVLLLGSGSTPARMRASLVTAGGFTVTDLSPLYHRLAAAFGVPLEHLNLEGACAAGDRMRWFHRGATTFCADVDLVGGLPAEIAGVRRYDLGHVGGVPLAVTDAVALDDGRVLVSAAAEDTPNPVDDGPVVGAALALLDDHGVLDTVALPEQTKVEGLAVRATTAGGLRLLAVVDADDPVVPSRELDLDVSW